MAINAAAAPINVDIDEIQTHWKDVGFWRYNRWSEERTSLVLEVCRGLPPVEQDLVAAHFGSADGSCEMEVWVPQSRVDSGPTHEDIMAWQTVNKTAETATYNSQALSVLAEVHRTCRSTEVPPGSNPKVLKEHHTESARRYLAAKIRSSRLMLLQQRR